MCTVCRNLEGIGVKFGYQFLFAHGLERASKLAQGMPLILDLKLHDIPNTVGKGVISALAHAPEAYITIHLEGGRAMLEAAAEKCDKLLGVTSLTSLDREDLGGTSPEEIAVHRAQIAAECGLAGVVCSGLEAAAVRKALGPESFILTPGVRINPSNASDQKRTTTPEAALKAGASAVVMGREALAAARESEAALRSLLRSYKTC